MFATRHRWPRRCRPGSTNSVGVDIVIANAGIAPMQSGEDGWRDVVDVNLTGVHHTVDVAIPTMVEQADGGAIVLTSSAAGLVGIGGDDPGSLGYTAAKHGVVGLMRAYANHLAPHSIRVNSIHPAAVMTPMINNEFTRQWLARITQESDAPVDFGMALPVKAVAAEDIAAAVAWLVSDEAWYITGSDVAGRRGLRQQALTMSRNPAAQTAFGPMVQAAIEQYEPPERRLVSDDLALSILPPGQRAMVRAMRWPLLRRLTISAGERAVPGSWALIACRKRFIDDKLNEALGNIDAIVDLGAGMDTRAYRLVRQSDIPVFEVDLPVNIGRKKAAVQRAIAVMPASVHLVPLDFERDDLITTLTGHGYRPDVRTFFIWEGVTQYLTEDAVRATLGALQAAPGGSRLVFTYVRRDFIDGVNMYDAAILYKRFRQRQQVWRFGLDPDEVSEFVAEYGWRLVEQAGPDYYLRNYIRPTGRHLAASQLEWTAYAEKPRIPPRSSRL